MEILRFSFTLSWPMYSRSFLGRSESSVWRSSSSGSGLRRRSSGTSVHCSGQRHRDHRPAPLARADVDAAAVLLHDAIRDGHAEAGAGGEVRAEGLEETALVGVRHAAAAVAEDDVVRAVRDLGLHAQAAAARHRLYGVAGDVPEDLPDLVAVADDRVRLRRDLALDRVRRAELRRVREEIERLRETRRDVELRGALLLRLHEAEEVGDRFVEPLRL